jgi:hypothetical protein
MRSTFDKNMNGPLAQIVALTCYGNAFIGGGNVPQFFPDNSTCKFCDKINFVEFKKPIFGQAKEYVVAKSPDEWFLLLKKKGAKGIRLVRQAQNDPKISDRMSAGFVGGGGTWTMEVLKQNGRSEFWVSRWDVWNQNAPEQRIWRVSYGLMREASTQPYFAREMLTVKTDFKNCLEAIHTFSSRENCGGFTKCFANALIALVDSSADIGYHKDIAPPNLLNVEAQSMLKASMSAWVFGGMGSWNDMGFDGAIHKEYEMVSENLFTIINEAIEISATSTTPTR